MIAVTGELLSAGAVPGSLDPDQAVEAGRRSLDHWWRYPWYDRAADDLNRIDVAPPWWLDWLPDWQGFQLGSWPNNMLEWVAWIVIAAALGLLVWLLVRTYRARRGIGFQRSGRDLPGTNPADERRRIEALPLPADRRQIDLLAEAERYYRDGHYGMAIVYLFSYQLVQLDRHRLIHLTKGKTNRQYLRELGRRTPLRRLLEQSMIAFEDVFFGHHTMDRLRFESCWSRLDEFEALAAEAAQ